MKVVIKSDCEYEQRLSALQATETDKGRMIGFAAPTSVFDEWHAEIKQRQQASPRVEAKLQQLWGAQDYRGLASLLQFTPAKYSVVRHPVTVEQRKQQLNDLVQVTTYTLTAPSITHVLVYIHGGGLVNGTAERNADWLQALLGQLGSNWAIVNIDYPLITQTDLPTLLAAVVPIASQVAQWYPTARLYLAGDSSGATLAMYTRDQNPALISGQILIYPQWQFGGTIKSNQSNALPYLADFNRMLNVQTALINQQIAKPIKMQLNNTLPTLIIKAEYDAFNDDLRDQIASVKLPNEKVAITTFKGMFHGFIDYFGHLPQAESALNEIKAWLTQH